MDGLPEIGDIISADAIDIDNVRVLLRAIADDLAAEGLGAQGDAQDETAAQVQFAVDERKPGVMLPQVLVIDAEAGARKELLRMPAAKADLVEPRALAHAHAEAARRDFGIEPPLVAALDMVENLAAVGDEPGENVEPAGRTLRIGGGRKALRQRQEFEQRNDIDAAAFEHRAVALKADLVRFQHRELIFDTALLAGQKAGAHPMRRRTQPQIEARGLQLSGLDVAEAADHPAAQHQLDLLAPKQAEMRAEQAGILVFERQGIQGHRKVLSAETNPAGGTGVKAESRLRTAIFP